MRASDLVSERERPRVPPKLAVEALKPHIWKPGEEIKVTTSQNHPASIENLLKNGLGVENQDLAVSLEKAMELAKKGGVVATLPYLTAGLANAEDGNYLRESWITALSEEVYGIDTEGKFVEKGPPVMVVVHGGAFFTPERIRRPATVVRLTIFGGLVKGVQSSQEEFDALLRGELSDGDFINLYTIKEVAAGKVCDPFGRYGVVFYDQRYKDCETLQFSRKEFLEDPLVLARAGTPEYLEKLFDNIDCRIAGIKSRFIPFDNRAPNSPISYGTFVDFQTCVFENIRALMHGRFIYVPDEA